MNFLPNTNDKDCDKDITGFGDGDCCCNCINQVKCIHPILGFVGYLCKLQFQIIQTYITYLSVLIQCVKCIQG